MTPEKTVGDAVCKTVGVTGGTVGKMVAIATGIVVGDALRLGAIDGARVGNELGISVGAVVAKAATSSAKIRPNISP